MDVAILKCTACKKRTPIFFRPYSGEKLCKTCFIRSIEEKAKATIAEYKMLEFDDRIAVAVSGGKDSVSLLHVLAGMEQDRPKASLAAITVDEGIRGYRDEALKIAIENCTKLQIEHHMVSFKELFGRTFDEIVELAKRNGHNRISPCAYCGVLRRRALNLSARRIKADKLATAHTLDDEVQTALLNIFHGDVGRLAKEKPLTDRVHPGLVRRIKPFCEIPERETALYAHIRSVEFQGAPCPYASEALRNDVRTMLNRMERKHAGIKFTIFNSMERIRSAMEGVEKKEGLTECAECGEPTTERVCRTCQMLKQFE